MSGSVDFFENQFQRQVTAGEFELNPFERATLDFVKGCVLDLGCGLGNLTLEAARRGCEVTAVDASPTAIRRICVAAQQERLAIEAVQADVGEFRIAQDYDTIVAIGLLMFFPEARSLAMLDELQSRVRPAGRAIVNVLTEGTTYMGMFTPGQYYLFRRGELTDRFAGWELEFQRHDDFPAPGGTVKAFDTVVARKPLQ